MEFQRMQRDYANIRNLILEIARHKNLKVTVKRSLLAGVSAGVGGLLGSILMGSRGVALGSLLGGFLYYTGTDDFRPLWKVLSELSQDDLMKLILAVIRVLTETVPSIAYSTVRLTDLDDHLIQCIANEICQYTVNEIHLTMAS